MKTRLIVTSIGIALLLSIGVLATIYAQSAFAIGQTATSGTTNSGNAGAGGTAGNGGNGGIAVGQYASANGGSAEANGGSLDVQAHTKQAADCHGGSGGSGNQNGNSC